MRILLNNVTKMFHNNSLCKPFFFWEINTIMRKARCTSFYYLYSYCKWVQVLLVQIWNIANLTLLNHHEKSDKQSKFYHRTNNTFALYLACRNDFLYYLHYVLFSTLICIQFYHATTPVHDRTMQWIQSNLIFIFVLLKNMLQCQINLVKIQSGCWHRWVMETTASPMCSLIAFFLFLSPALM